MIDKRIAAYQSTLIQTYYSEVEVMYKQIRGWRHDYRNHMQVLKSIALSGDIEILLNKHGDNFYDTITPIKEMM